MLSLREWFLVLMLLVVAVIYDVSNADASSVKIHVTPRMSSQPQTNEVEVISVRDNQDGTSSVYVSACGALIEAVASQDSWKAKDPRIEQAVIKAVMQVCQPAD